MKINSFVLLQIKQVPGIEQEQLLAYLSDKYKNIQSARAALSRAIRMLLALDLIEKKGKAFYITKKGLLKLKVELKEKIILILNELINQPKAYKAIDKIIANLTILIEKGKNDKDLLHSAISQSAFFISDLERISKAFENYLKHQEYLNNVLQKKIEFLKELNFNEIIELKASKENFKKIFSLSESKTIFFTTINALLGKHITKALGVKPKRGNFLIERKHLKKLINILLERKNTRFEFTLTQIKVKHVMGVLLVEGPYKKIVKLKAAVV